MWFLKYIGFIGLIVYTLWVRAQGLGVVDHGSGARGLDQVRRKGGILWTDKNLRFLCLNNHQP